LDLRRPLAFGDQASMRASSSSLPIAITPSTPSARARNASAASQYSRPSAPASAAGRRPNSAASAWRDVEIVVHAGLELGARSLDELHARAGIRGRALAARLAPQPRRQVVERRERARRVCTPPR
jgi:hypothetical protein